MSRASGRPRASWWYRCVGLLVCACVVGPSVRAHHDSGHTAGLVGFTTAGQAGYAGEPVSFLSVQEDWLRAERSPATEPVTLAGRSIQPAVVGQSLLVTTLTGEYAFNRYVSAGLQLPVVRVERKGETDYTRLGRALLGARVSPLRGLLPESIFLTVYAGAGLPSGADAGVARGGDFWSGHGGLFGGWRLGRFSVALAAEGEWPLSRLEAEEEETPLSRLEHLLSGEAFEVHEQTFVLKKVTRFTGLVFFHPNSWLSLFVGHQYQDPFYGMVRDTRLEPPRVYREAQLGLELRLGEATLLSAAYRYPLERGADRKRYEEIYSFAVTRLFRTPGPAAKERTNGGKAAD